jgi:hypothetical protein
MNKTLTKAIVTAGAFGVLATGLATGASAASAAVRHPVTAVTNISNRDDGGGGGVWAKDTFTRTLTVNYLGKVLVTPAMVTANPSLAPYLGQELYQYNAQVNDQGSFRDLPGQLTPNQGGHNAGRVLKPVQVSGPMSGFGQWNVFYASARAHNGLVPTVLRGPVNSAYPSSTWPELAFPAGTTFVGVNEGAYDYNYQAVPFTKHVARYVNGKWVIETVHGFRQHWDDSAWNGDGQLRADGNITGLNH